MAAPSRTSPVDDRIEPLRLIASLDRLDFSRATVSGDYVRFDETARNALKDFRGKVLGGLSGASRHPSNFLIWGAPGSGKTFLVQQVAAAAGLEVRLVEANLAQLNAEQIQLRLAEVAAADSDVVCLVDEVDAHPSEAWPYESLLPALEPSSLPEHRRVYCLAGSGGANLEEFVQRIANRPKGPDLLSRIPSSHRYTVPSLQAGDKLLVASSQMLLAAASEGRTVREIEKFALFYLASKKDLSSARQLRAIAVESARRIPPGEDRLRYDHLFTAGDPENKRFWNAHRDARIELADRFVVVGPGATHREGSPPAAGSSAKAIARGTAETGLTRIAILPFANISADPSDRYISDGLTEELIAMVSKVPGLRVIARTSVEKYRAGAHSVADAARELGVTAVIEGSVRKAGDALRVTAQLIDAETEAPAWSMTFDRKLENVFVIQEELAHRIADSLHIRLLGDSAARIAKVPTRSLAAYELYLQARQLFFVTTETGFREAIALYERAVALDPTFALAFCGLAEANAIQGNRGLAPLRVALERAEGHARRALQLDNGLAEAHAALAPVLYNRYDWNGALHELDRALLLDPSNVQAHFWRAVTLGTLGRPEEGLANAQRAVELDPLNPRRLVILGQQYYWMRRYDDAIATLSEARRAGAADIHGMLAYAYLLSGLGEDAVQEATKALHDPLSHPVQARMDLAAVLARTGQPERARELLAQLEHPQQTLEVPAGAIAWIEASLGQMDRALGAYSRARVEGSMLGIPDLVVDPVIDDFRRDPRFPDLLRLFNLPLPARSTSQ
jgi:TolB-like protein/Flp pilus assembly protein TadD